MGLDWTALEQGLHRVAREKAAAIIGDHPTESFYALALHGVPTQEDEALVLPVLGLNSEQALARIVAEEAAAGRPPSQEEDEVDEEEGGDWVDPPLDGSDPPEETEDEDSDDVSDDEPDEDSDADADEDGGGFYSRRWDPTEWHWNSVDLVSEEAQGIWERNFAAEVQRQGWEATALKYYELMVRVVNALREELASEGTHLVCFVADDDHAERLLRASLTAEQLGEHFPELAAG